MSELKEKIKEAVNKHLDTAIALSKDLAEHPELPYQEFESSRKMAEILKEAGFNAIRSSHNPISKAMLDACDQLGMYIID